jgi:hypothetical protein
MLENINSNLSILHLEVQRYRWLFVVSCLKLNPLTCKVPNSVDIILNDRATTAVERELTLKRVIRTSWDHVGGNPSIGIVDKQCSGFIKHRLIHDLSRPDGSLQIQELLWERGLSLQLGYYGCYSPRIIYGEDRCFRILSTISNGNSPM